MEIYVATITHNLCTIVDGMLQVDDLDVDRTVDLTGCTALTALPKGLKVGYHLCLSDCTRLTSLPEGLSVGLDLWISDCTALTSLPEGLSVGINLVVKGCTAVRTLPTRMQVGRSFVIDSLCIYNDSVTLMDKELPETVQNLAVGRRLGDVIDHWVLRDLGTAERIIEECEKDRLLGGVKFRLSSFQIAGTQYGIEDCGRPAAQRPVEPIDRDLADTQSR